MRKVAFLTLINILLYGTLYFILRKYISHQGLRIWFSALYFLILPIASLIIFERFTGIVNSLAVKSGRTIIIIAGGWLVFHLILHYKRKHTFTGLLTDLIINTIPIPLMTGMAGILAYFLCQYTGKIVKSLYPRKNPE